MNEIQIVIPTINYKKIFWILAAFIGILMPILSFDYGIIEDSEINYDHGEVILNYFTGKDSLAAQSILNEKWELPKFVDLMIKQI